MAFSTTLTSFSSSLSVPLPSFSSCFPYFSSPGLNFEFLDPIVEQRNKKRWTENKKNIYELENLKAGFRGWFAINSRIENFERFVFFFSTRVGVNISKKFIYKTRYDTVIIFFHLNDETTNVIKTGKHSHQKPQPAADISVDAKNPNKSFSFIVK
jgi:hypothetical protein